MAANLYDAAFSTLGRIFGVGARRPITALTLAGGFASTVSWPMTHFLLERVDWRSTYLILCGAARFRRGAAARSGAAADALSIRHCSVRFGKRARESAAGLRVAVHSCGVGVCLLRLRPVRIIGALAGHFCARGYRRCHCGVDRRVVRPRPGRRSLDEFAFGRNLHPLWIARFALTTFLCAFLMLVLLGVSTATAAAFALMFGGANGLITITRGAVPLALFGASGYGRLMDGWSVFFCSCRRRRLSSWHS